MSQFFDDLEAQLSAAATARIARRHRARRRRFPWLRRGLRLAPVLAAGLVALAVAAVVLTMIGPGKTNGVASGGNSRPPSGPLTTAQLEAKYFNRAFNPILASDPACAPRGLLGTGSGQLRLGRPSEALLAILRILRRPATSADQLPRGSRGPEGLTLPGYVYVHYIRFARVVAGVRYYVVVAHIPASPPLPGRCYRELRSALARELPSTVPEPERARLQGIAAERLTPVPTHPYDGVFLIGAGETGGASASQLEHDGAVIMSSGRTISGVVPDGVAAVKLPLRPSPGHPSRTVTATVVSNVFVVKPQRATLPTGEIWLSVTGNVIHRVNLDQ